MLLSNLVWFRMASAVPRYYVTKVSLDAPQTLLRERLKQPDQMNSLTGHQALARGATDQWSASIGPPRTDRPLQTFRMFHGCGAVNARALSLARKAVDLCNCRRREAAAECLVEKQVELVSFAEDPVMVVATLRLDVALAGGVVERPLTTEPALLAAHVCKAGALFGVAEGELVSNGAGVASGVGAADPNRQATPEGGPKFDLADLVFAPREPRPAQPGRFCSPR